MIRIFLICSGGMSSSFLVSRMQDAAQLKDQEITIQAFGQADIDTIIETCDLLLIAPQIRYLYPKIQKNYPNKCIEIIPSIAYGRMDGIQVLEFALKHLK